MWAVSLVSYVHTCKIIYSSGRLAEQRHSGSQANSGEGQPTSPSVMPTGGDVNVAHMPGHLVGGVTAAPAALQRRPMLASPAYALLALHQDGQCMQHHKSHPARHRQPYRECPTLRIAHEREHPG